MPERFDVAHVEGGRRFGAWLAPTIYAARALHADLVPAAGPIIVVSNHSGFLDGPLVFCLCPRPLHFLVKRAYFASVWGAILRQVGQIPITQDSGDREALQAARSVLAQGGAVGVFPEGTRGSGTVQSAHHGAAWLAIQSGAVIVPAATLGTRGTGGARESWPKPRAPLRVVFGEPFRVDNVSGSGRERLRQATELLRVRLAAHVDAAVVETGMTLPADDAAV